jgi:hypothetical protein
MLLPENSEWNEGLADGVEVRGVDRSESRAPGLKPSLSAAGFLGPEGPCSRRRFRKATADLSTRLLKQTPLKMTGFSGGTGVGGFPGHRSETGGSRPLMRPATPARA